MKTAVRILAAMILAFAVFGCDSTTPQPTPPPPTRPPMQLPTSTDKPLLPTETLLPSPTSTSMPVCPAINPEVDLVLPTSDGLIDDNVLAYLNAGGDPEQIASFLVSNNLTTLDVSVTDLNGDNLNEVVVAGALPLEFGSTNEGWIYIFTCETSSYELDGRFMLGKISGVAPIRTEKLLAGHPQQIIVESWRLIGWASDILAIGFMDGKWQVLFQDSEILPRLVIFDQDNDGNKEISLISQTTATQGPQRKMISNYKWDGKEYVWVSSQLMPGRTRVEYLNDAQRALDQGDIPLAIEYYSRAAYDDTLQDFASRGEWFEKETHLAGAYQISFALFRLSALWLSTGDDETAQSILDDLTEQFPKSKPGHEFAEAASVFHDQMSQGATAKQACAKVATFFTQNYSDLNIHIGDWGVSVVGYDQLIELCPFR